MAEFTWLPANQATVVDVEAAGLIGSVDGHVAAPGRRRAEGCRAALRLASAHTERQGGPMVTRDRNEEGRPRQARPRDELGRPLPYGAVGVEPVSEDPLPPLETVRFAIELLDQGRPFSAHEVFEARWKDAPDAERNLWQGLAQLCVGLTHALRGNATGAERLIERGNGRLARYAEAGGPTYGLDLTEFQRRIHDMVGND